jgi:outer membrane lipoprotein-sorting protein
MAGNDRAGITEEGGNRATGRRKTARYALPVAVAGVAAVTVGLVPALAASGDPDLPRISAHDLVQKIAASHTERLSGSVKITTDLGLPSLGGLGGSMAGAMAPGSGGSSGAPSGSTANPESKLMELASGTHTLRVAADGPQKQKVSIIENAAEYSLIRNGTQVWAYDSASNQAFHTTAPKDTGKASAAPVPGLPKGGDLPTTPGQLTDDVLKAAGSTTSFRVDGTSKVAGRDAYDLVIKPKQAGSTVDSIRVAVDSKTGAPLKFTLLPSGGGKAVVDAGYTSVDFGKPAASTFTFTPPKGTKVTEGKPQTMTPQETPSKQDQEHAKAALGKVKVTGTGWATVAEIPGSADAAGHSADKGGKADKPGPSQDAQGFLDSLGDKVSGKFGSGTVFHTRLVNALMTDDGTVYVGAVSRQHLIDTANAAAK